MVGRQNKASAQSRAPGCRDGVLQALEVFLDKMRYATPRSPNFAHWLSPWLEKEDKGDLQWS